MYGVLLKDYCEGRLGESAARIKWHRYADIEERNAKGECLLIMDGSMVLDVTRYVQLFNIALAVQISYK